VKNKFEKNSLVFILFAVIILIIMISLTVANRDEATLPEQFLGDTAALGQRVVNYPAEKISGVVDHLSDAFTAIEENKKLKEMVAGYPQVQSDLHRLKKENSALKKQLKTDSIDEYEPLSATVIARNPDQWMNSFVINKGETSGVDEGMAIISTGGLIGKVTKVNKYSATVEMITSTLNDSKLSVIAQEKGQDVFGLVQSYDDKNNHIVVEDMDNNTKLKKGTKVVTSGLGGQFPKGLLIGEITKIENDQFGLSQIAYVKPSVNLDDISYVYVAMRNDKTLEQGSDE